ncbi:unnamed protein product [Diamesa serratosioi]
MTNDVLSSGQLGYDSVECDPTSSKARSGRARLIAAIPCDLTKQSYCNLPGEYYPWNAVKKFVYDNQGLVRRMYGDLRHIFVLKSELENEIEFEDMQHSADKYSKAFNTHNNQRQMKAKKVAAVVEKKNQRSNDVIEPHFRPTNKQSAINNKLKTKPPKAVTTEQQQAENFGVLDNIIKDIIESNALNAQSEVAGNIFGIQKTTKLTSILPTSTPSIIDNLKEKTSDTKVSEKDPENEAKIVEIVDKAVESLLSNISLALSSSISTTTSTTVRTTTLNAAANKTEKLSFTLKNNRPVQPELLKGEEELEEAIVSEIFGLDDMETAASNDDLEKDKLNKKSSSPTTMETQLFQDTVQKEKEQAPPQMNRRGVNACPVKEEVVAPFWGNNTRGEVLALLNVYPFEQYINWEKCTHEHEQMYCRDGCKCEQQYRLHRLLAYNPYDPCRGIFSDWFRFPSCCICKCYDVPLDYRVTSRSPRSSKLLEATADVPMTLFDDEDNRNSYGP